MPSTNRTNAAAKKIADNDDVLTEILIRVPVKPLLRFKCMSRRWLSLISDPYFSRRHQHHHHHHHCSSLSGILLCRSIPSHYQFLPLDGTRSSLPFKSLDYISDDSSHFPSPSGVKILQSRNGLFLCRSLENKSGDKRHCYYVCNPTTKHFSKLPFPDTDWANAISGLTLAFEPSKSPYYQVVCVRSTAVPPYNYQIEVYSSETRAWRASGSPFVAPYDMVFHQGVCWNGAVHWLSPSGAAMYFNIDKEVFGTMPSPSRSEAQGTRRFRYFDESGGHLHLIEIYGARTTQFRVLEMASDYAGWFVKYDVDLRGIVVSYPEMVRNFLDQRDSCYFAFIIVFVLRKEEEAELLLHVPGKIVSYNLRDRSVKELCEIGPYPLENRYKLQFGWLDAYPYVETLACV